jgi:hypothetical protein
MSRMEINEIRRRNLRSLLDAFIASGKKKKDFAEKVGIEAPQLTHITAEPPKRNIGDMIARRIEERLGLQRGWLDVTKSSDAIKRSVEDRNFVIQGINNAYITGQINSKGFNLIKLSEQDFTGDAKLETVSSVITEISIDEESAKTLFGGRDSEMLRIHTVHGDSMSGYINPGEVVVLDTSVNDASADGIYLFVYDGKVHLKRLQRVKKELLVISDNPVYERWSILEDEMESLEIIGFLVGKWDMTYTRLG